MNVGPGAYTAPVLECACQTAPELCPECRESRWMQLKGVAARRGELWGYRLRATTIFPPRMRAVIEREADRLVTDLARDPVLRARLAAEVLRFALR